MKETPIDYSVVQEVINEFNLPDFGKATIREVVGMTNQIEKTQWKTFYPHGNGCTRSSGIKNRCSGRN